MPEYEFQRGDGSIVTKFFGMTEAVPVLGEVVEIDGVACRRVFATRLRIQGNPVKGRYPYEAHSINRKASGIRSWSKRGVPIIESRAHERNVCAMNDLVKRD